MTKTLLQVAMPFLKSNEIVIDMMNDTIIVQGSAVISYGPQDNHSDNISYSAETGVTGDDIKPSHITLQTVAKDCSDYKIRPQLPGLKASISSNDNQEYSDDQRFVQCILKSTHYASQRRLIDVDHEECSLDQHISHISRDQYAMKD